MQPGRPQVQRDSDVVYQRAWEWHGAISFKDVKELGRAWSPRTRVEAAVRYLAQEGLVELRHHPPAVDGLWLHITNPADALGWTRQPST